MLTFGLLQVARNLQDCLALANFKAQNGWQNKTLKAIEPEVTEKLRRKRPFPNGDILSDSSSSASESAPYSSPLTAPIFSDEVVPGSSHSNRSRLGAPAHFPLQKTNSNKRLRANSTHEPTIKSSRHVSWKVSHQLPQSSPVLHHPVSASFDGHSSFVSDSATIPLPANDQSPMFSRSSDHTIADDDSDNDLPMHSFSQRPSSSSMVVASPPRTPPPTRHSKSAMAGPSKSGAAADLLLYLANSPSRSPNPRGTNNYSPTHGHPNPPSTPPSTQSHLPSSILATPSNSHNLSTSLFNGALATTPGNNINFNFADFVNVTPSPAQAPWGGRTPGGPKTPGLAARIARRGLNFDALVPPGNDTKSKEEEKRKGLALELGEELMPRR